MQAVEVDAARLQAAEAETARLRAVDFQVTQPYDADKLVIGQLTPPRLQRGGGGEAAAAIRSPGSQVPRASASRLPMAKSLAKRQRMQAEQKHLVEHSQVDHSSVRQPVSNVSTGLSHLAPKLSGLGNRTEQAAALRAPISPRVNGHITSTSTSGTLVAEQPSSHSQPAVISSSAGVPGVAASKALETAGGFSAQGLATPLHEVPTEFPVPKLRFSASNSHMSSPHVPKQPDVSLQTPRQSMPPRKQAVENPAPSTDAANELQVELLSSALVEFVPQEPATDLEIVELEEQLADTAAQLACSKTQLKSLANAKLQDTRDLADRVELLERLLALALQNKMVPSGEVTALLTTGDVHDSLVKQANDRGTPHCSLEQQPNNDTLSISNSVTDPASGILVHQCKEDAAAEALPTNFSGSPQASAAITHASVEAHRWAAAVVEEAHKMDTAQEEAAAAKADGDEVAWQQATMQAASAKAARTKAAKEAAVWELVVQKEARKFQALELAALLHSNSSLAAAVDECVADVLAFSAHTEQGAVESDAHEVTTDPEARVYSIGASAAEGQQADNSSDKHILTFVHEMNSLEVSPNSRATSGTDSGDQQQHTAVHLSDAASRVEVPQLQSNEQDRLDAAKQAPEADELKQQSTSAIGNGAVRGEQGTDQQNDLPSGFNQTHPSQPNNGSPRTTHASVEAHRWAAAVVEEAHKMDTAQEEAAAAKADGDEVAWQQATMQAASAKAARTKAAKEAAVWELVVQKEARKFQALELAALLHSNSSLAAAVDECVADVLAFSAHTEQGAVESDAHEVTTDPEARVYSIGASAAEGQQADNSSDKHILTFVHEMNSLEVSPNSRATSGTDSGDQQQHTAVHLSDAASRVEVPQLQSNEQDRLDAAKQAPEADELKQQSTSAIGNGAVRGEQGTDQQNDLPSGFNQTHPSQPNNGSPRTTHASVEAHRWAATVVEEAHKLDIAQEEAAAAKADGDEVAWQQANVQAASAKAARAKAAKEAAVWELVVQKEASKVCDAISPPADDAVTVTAAARSTAGLSQVVPQPVGNTTGRRSHSRDAMRKDAMRKMRSELESLKGMISTRVAKVGRDGQEGQVETIHTLAEENVQLRRKVEVLQAKVHK